MHATIGPVHRVVSDEQWVKEHAAHLAKEKELTRLKDELARRRRELPWRKVTTEYVFETPGGRRTLGQLFGGRSQLVVYHFMLGPGWPEGCPSCSMAADGFDAAVTHLRQRGVTFAAVSRAPMEEIESFKWRMGWRFDWVSSYGTEFNRDFGVTFTKDEVAAGATAYNFGTFAEFPAEEAPGVSVFYKDGNGDVYHTFSAYARGVEPLLGVYYFLDLTPKGRDEEGMSPHPMAWVRHHDRYGVAPSPTPAGAAVGCGCGCEKGES